MISLIPKYLLTYSHVQGFLGLVVTAVTFLVKFLMDLL